MYDKYCWSYWPVCIERQQLPAKARYISYQGCAMHPNIYYSLVNLFFTKPMYIHPKDPQYS